MESRRRRREGGVTMVEFALIAPLALVLILGLLVTGIVVLNQVELTNGVRDGARAAAVCGGAGFQDTTGSIKLPNGQACTQSNLNSYIQSRIQTIPGVTPIVQVFVNGSPQSLDKCQKGQIVSVTASYAQPLYAPLVGVWLGDPGNSAVRTLNATAEATCEQ
jgi:Flp pilus assembly protein TadG